MKNFLLGLCAILIGTGTASAGIEATGEGPTLELALMTAMRHAVEQKTGAFLRSDTTVIDSQLVSDKILTHSKGYVTSYSITKQVKIENGLSVTIDAEVDNNVLKDDVDALTILRKNMGNPGVLVAFSQKGEGAQFYKNKDFIEEIYSGIVESLTDNQFRVVDKSASENFTRQVSEAHEINTYLNKAADYGLKYNAEYTLLYSVSGEVFDGAAGDKRVKLRIKTRLIDNFRSLEIANKVIEEAGSAATMANALEKAAREGGRHAVGPVIDSIRKNWMDMQQNGSLYIIVIDGVRDSEEISRFSEMFEKFPLVNGTKEVESGGGKTTFEATYKGKRDQLDRDVVRVSKELGWDLKKVRAEGARSSWKKM